MSAIYESARPQVGVRKLRVLLVDDDQDDYLLFERQLERLKEFDVELTWANDYDDALRQMQSQSFDAHFVDFRLAHSSGLELVSRALDRHPGRSFVLLTAFGDENLAAECLRRGAVAFLSKADLDGEHLRHCIDACTSDHGRLAHIGSKVDTKLTDAVTGAYLLPTFMGAARKELEAESDSAQQQLLLRIEVDGDEPANAVLRNVADAIRSCLRRSDMFARCGKSAFCVLTQISSSWMARELAENLMIAIEDSTGASVRIGTAQSMSGRSTLDELMERALVAVAKTYRPGHSRLELD